MHSSWISLDSSKFFIMHKSLFLMIDMNLIIYILGGWTKQFIKMLLAASLCGRYRLSLTIRIRYVRAWGTIEKSILLNLGHWSWNEIGSILFKKNDLKKRLESNSLIDFLNEIIAIFYYFGWYIRRNISVVFILYDMESIHEH